MKLLITGTAGFIGFHLVERMLSDVQNIEIVGFDCINDYYDVNLKYDRLRQHGIDPNEVKEGAVTKSKKYPNYSFVKGHLENKELLDKLFVSMNFTHVCNLAAQAGVRYSLVNPYAYIESNIVGFINVLECCRHNNIEHLAYASSSSVYGLNESMPFSVHDNVDHPISLYAASKKSNELMAHTYSHLYGIPTTGLRFFTVYGPWGRPDMALFLFTKAILNKEPINVFNHGKMRRDFTYVGDIVEGVKRVILNPAKANSNWSGKSPDPGTSKSPYQIYNIGNNNPIELMDFISAIETNLGTTAEKNFMPLQDGDVPATYADVEDLVKNLDYKPETTVDEGVERFLKWFRIYYKIDR